ncbi:MAG TPA: CHAT domain-containing protein, partial [Herpetosiphonaceae bacterium]
RYDVPMPPPDRALLLNLGASITEMLPLQTQQGFARALRRARKRRTRLRVIINVASDALALLAIPWELMALEPDGPGTGGLDFLLLDPLVSMLRQIEGVGTSASAALPHPLGILAVAAQPIGVAPFDSAPLRESVGACAGWQTGRWYDQENTVPVLHERVRALEPRILHLLCHGERQAAGARDFRHDLLLTHEDGYQRRASIYELGSIVALAPQLRLVVLQSCHGGNASAHESRVNESIALGLLRRQVPFVIGFQGEVTQKAADAFVRELYARLEEGRPLDEAVTLSRRAVNLRDAMDWSLPVLYQGSERPEASAGLGWLADWIELALRNPSAHRVVRGSLVALALALLTCGLAYWLILPQVTLAHLRGLFARMRDLTIFVGVIGPAVIAAAYPRVYRSTTLRREALLAQWSGAYLGYGTGQAMGFLVALIGLALLGGPAPGLEIQLGIIVAVAGWALVWSYFGMRSQVRSVLILAEDNPELFGMGFLAVMLAIGLVLALGCPVLALWLLGSGETVLSHPTSVSLTLAMLLIWAVLRFNE